MFLMWELFHVSFNKFMHIIKALADACNRHAGPHIKNNAYTKNVLHLSLSIYTYIYKNSGHIFIHLQLFDVEQLFDIA